MKHTILAAAAALAFAVPTLSQAATVTSTYTQILGNKWSVNFNLINDGAPAVLTGLTVYFPVASFASLLVYTSPAGWDSLAIQPDANLPSAGFFDTFAMDAGSALTQGQSQAGFEVRFTYLGTGRPGALSFDINDPAYNVLYSGVTTVVPEPASAMLTLLGLCAIGAYRARRSATAEQQHKSEMTA